MKLHHRDDEEPDFGEELTPWNKWLDAVRGLCGYCGQEGHQKDKCPSRPISDYGGMA